MKIPCVLIVVCLCSSCSSNIPPSSRQGQGYMYNEYISDVLTKCENESALITLTMYDAAVKNGEHPSEQDVRNLERMLKESCWRYYGILI